MQYFDFLHSSQVYGNRLSSSEDFTNFKEQKFDYEPTSG